MVEGPHYCYILRNGKGSSYVGYTNNPDRRLRQHNGELCGGARRTRGRGPWTYWILLRLGTYSEALSAEYHLKRCRCRSSVSVLLVQLYRKVPCVRIYEVKVDASDLDETAAVSDGTTTFSPIA